MASILEKHAILEKNATLLLVGSLLVVTIGGALYLIGVLIMAYNLWRTVRSPALASDNLQAPQLAAEAV